MAGRQSKMSNKHLECPVCLDVFRDPRMLPCAHTICKHCIEGLVHDSTIICPMCRATHAAPPAGGDGYPSNYVLVGMLDSLCGECRSVEPEVRCSHCQNMLCLGCQRSHLGFEVAKQSVQKISDSLHNAVAAMQDTDIEHLGLLVEKEITKAAAYLIQEVQERSKKLINEVKTVIKTNLNARNTWKDDVEATMVTAQSFLDTKTRLLGDVYGNHITDEAMAEIRMQSQNTVSEIELVLNKVPSLSKPFLRYHSTEVVSVIRSFGAIELHPPGTDDCPVAVDGPCTKQANTPRVVGKSGSGPGEFLCPYDVSVCPVTGHVIVADSNNNRIQVLDDGLRHVMNITDNGHGGHLVDPTGVATSSTGDIIVTDYQAHNVLVYSKTGEYRRELTGPWSDPWGVTLDEDDNIYVCDTGSYSIKVCDKAGNSIRSFGSEGSAPGRFSSYPTYITIHNDHVMVSDANGQIYKFTKSGSYVNMLDPGIVRKAMGLTVDWAGDIVIVDVEGPVTIVRDGRVVSKIGECGKETGQLDNPQGVAVTRSGQVIVVNYGPDNLLVYDAVKKIYAS